MTDPHQPTAATPEPPSSSPATPTSPVTPETRAPNPKRRQKIALGVLLAVVLVIAGIAYFATRDNPESAKVGDCVHQTGENSVKVIACTDPDAAFKVVGRVEDQTEVDASLTACDPFEAQNPTSVYWSGEEGGKGYVLCLAENK
jgi:hypothetical protein